LASLPRGFLCVIICVEQVETHIRTNGDSEFLKAVDGRKADKVWKLVDELVEAVKILHPRMYTTFINKVQDT
jgi:hypothetical protein